MTADIGEPDSPGPDRGKRGVMRRESLTRNTGEDPESHKPVHETTTDSWTGKNETRGGAVVAAPRHRLGMDERGLPAHPQGWCSWHRRCDGERLCEEPGSQSFGPPGSRQVGSLQSTPGAQDIYPKSGWLASAARDSFLRRQVGAAGNRHGAGVGVRAGLSSLLVRIPARSFGSSGIAEFKCSLHETKTAVGVGHRHRKIFRFDSALSP